MLTGYNSKQYSAGDKEPAPLPPGKARIYSMRFCPFCERTLLYAAKQAIEVEIVNINFSEKPEWYFKKNAKGCVPTFEQDGKLVTESSQIPLLLDDLHPDTAILPKDPFVRAHHRILADHLSIVNEAFFGVNNLLKLEETTEDDVEKTISEIEQALDAAEMCLRTGNIYFGGEFPSYPDYMVYPFVERIWVSITIIIPQLLENKRIVTPFLGAFPKSIDLPFPGTDHWPQLTQWFAAMRKSDEVNAVTQLPELLAAFIARHATGEVDSDFGI